MIRDVTVSIFPSRSQAGDAAYPGGSVYCATKAAVKALSDGLRIDLVEGLLAFDPKSDVTKEVIAEMDKTKVTFAPVKLEPITAAPKADDKAAPKADAKPEAKK